MSQRFLPFEESRKYVHSLKLKSSTEWVKFCKSENFPHNIPKRPEGTYADDGWNGYSDWLGNGRGQYQLKARLPFEEARKFVHSLGLLGLKDWWVYCKSGKRPANIPASPHTAYKEYWQGYGDWIGTGRKRYTDFLSFEESRKFAHSLKLFTTSSWEKFAKSDKRPKNIPYSPDQTYKKQWKGWGDWLHATDQIVTDHLVTIDDSEITDALDSITDNLKQVYLPYVQARDFVRKLGLKGQKEWFAYVKSIDKPKNIPAAPYQFYQEWNGFADWLGTKRIRPTTFLPFKDARDFVRKLGLKGKEEWEEYCKLKKRPISIPTNPEQYYSKTHEWTNWYDWLGKSRKKFSEGHTARRIISRFQELDKLNFSIDVIMNKLIDEFPEKSINQIKHILLKRTKYP